MNAFNFEEFDEFVKWENSRCVTRDNPATKNEAILVGVTKFMEENGELASEILINLKLVRKEKFYDNFDKLAEEFADCMIVLCMLADRCGIDMSKAIQDKMNVVKNRKY